MDSGTCLIVGASGLLGRHLAAHLRASGLHVQSCTRRELDVTDLKAMRSVVRVIKPSVIVNAVAATDVDGCEKDVVTAALLNAIVPANLALVAQAFKCLFVHISTDYVFSGTTGQYIEYDAPRPINVYGKSKLQGEQAVMNSGAEWLIVRTSGLYGRGGKNFLCKLPHLLRTERHLRVIDDLVLSPTYVVDLCETLRQLILYRANGLFHAVNEGQVSWCGAAQVMANLVGMHSTVTPASSADFKFVARRPQNSSLQNHRMQSQGIGMRSWQDALTDYTLTCFGR